MAAAPKQTLDNLNQPELFAKVSDICTLVNSVESTDELLQCSLKKTLDLFGATRGSIYVCKEDCEHLFLEAAEGMDRSDKKRMVKRLGQGVVGKVAQEKKPIVVSDIAQDERFRNYKARGSYKTPSFICAPLLIKDNLLGVINLADKEHGKRFKKEELQLLDFMASQIALNFRRIELYDKLNIIVKKSKNLEDELGKSSKEASHLKKQVVIQEKFANVGKLAGGIAHEFNNPLDGVMRYTNLCLEHIQDEVVRGYLLEIKQGLKRMANIVKNLLACSRNPAEVSAVVNPNYAVRQAVQSIQSLVAHKKIKFHQKLAKDLPTLPDLGLESVMTNLLRNSIDAIGDRNGNIEITTKFSDGYVAILVKDNGCGFAQEEVDKIFEPFYTTKDIQKGCGLGLTIVGEIVKSYYGQISVESAPGKGSTFIILLPIK